NLAGNTSWVDGQCLTADQKSAEQACKNSYQKVWDSNSKTCGNRSMATIANHTGADNYVSFNIDGNNYTVRVGVASSGKIPSGIQVKIKWTCTTLKTNFSLQTGETYTTSLGIVGVGSCGWGSIGCLSIEGAGLDQSQSDQDC